MDQQNRPALRLYKPSALPWIAKRKGAGNLVWYCIFDAYGDEVFSTGSDLRSEESKMMTQVAWTLSTANGSPLVEIDGEVIDVEWV